MYRKALIWLLFISIAGIATAQELSNDIIDVKYDKKSTRMAMALSAIFPGAGQAYANPKSITTYIFPIIEIGLWYGYFHFNKLGDDATKDYERWANKEVIGTYATDCNLLDENGDPYYLADDDMFRYDRFRYDYAYNNLIEDPLNNSSFYDEHFKLDGTNTQHFYEDIAKYNKYIMGWADWFDIYATDSSGDWVDPSWQWETNSSGINIWIGNEVINEDSEYYNSNSYGDIKKNSDMRSEYIKMRQDTEKHYDNVDYIKFGLIINRFLSSFDALRLTRNYNRNYLASNKVKIRVAPVYVRNQLCPGIILSKSF